MKFKELNASRHLNAFQVSNDTDYYLGSTHLISSYVSPSSGLKGFPVLSHCDATAETANAATHCSTQRYMTATFLLHKSTQNRFWIFKDWILFPFTETRFYRTADAQHHCAPFMKFSQSSSTMSYYTIHCVFKYNGHPIQGITYSGRVFSTWCFYSVYSMWLPQIK